MLYSMILPLSLVGEEKYEGKKWNPCIPKLSRIGENRMGFNEFEQKSP